MIHKYLRCRVRILANHNWYDVGANADQVPAIFKAKLVVSVELNVLKVNESKGLVETSGSGAEADKSDVFV